MSKNADAASQPEQEPQAVVEEFSDTCWCPQPDDGSDLLNPDNTCRFCGHQWKA